MIEDVVRFQYVQLGRAYIDVLAFALEEAGLDQLKAQIFDFPLALELGVATPSAWSFMELGLSRIAATALAPHFPDSNLTVNQARVWLKELNVEQLQLNPLILSELEGLGLLTE